VKYSLHVRILLLLLLLLGKRDDDTGNINLMGSLDDVSLVVL